MVINKPFSEAFQAVLFDSIARVVWQALVNEYR
jgi:hypothetical protein